MAETTKGDVKDLDLGCDLTIASIDTRIGAAGRWVKGTLHGHRFEALVFPQHAQNPEHEIGDSRISKLWIQSLEDGEVVYNWDRGQDVPPQDEMAKIIVDFLAAGLADYVYPKW
jgi:hypothetical protein